MDTNLILLDARDETVYDHMAEAEAEAEQQGRKQEFDDNRECLVLQNSQESSGETGTASEFRLPWLWVEGWRHRLRKAADEVERCHRTFDGLTSRGSSSSVSAGAMFRDARAGMGRSRVRKKSVHWADL